MKKINKLGYSLIEIILLILVIITFLSISSIMLLTANKNFKNQNRLNDLTRIDKAIKDYIDNGGRFNMIAQSYDDWTVAALTSKNIKKNSLDNDDWSSYDNTGNKPSFYLPGGVYPKDPVGEYYLIHIIDSKLNKYILKACNDIKNYKNEKDCISLTN